MPLDIIDRGRDNEIAVEAATLARLAGRVVITGDGNRLVIKDPFHAAALHLEMGEGSEILIDEGCHVGILSVHAPRLGSVRVGARSSFNGQTRFLLHEPGRIDVGVACLFGPDIDLTVSDMHSVIDLESGQRINPARDITIGDRVWLGIGTFVGKGAEVGAGSVVGARSFLGGRVPSNCLAAGAPARIVRENVSWHFDLQ